MGEEKNLTAANAISNYEKVYEYFRERLLKVDHYKIAEKLLLDIDEENIYIPYFHKKYAWIRTTGQIIPCEEEAPLEMSDRLLMMHHLYYYQDTAMPSTDKVPFREIRQAACFEGAYQKLALRPIVETFSGHPEKFKERAKVLGGRLEKYGDVSVTFQAFPTIEITVIFWDGDEEFPASANMLFDRNITQWIHPESVPGLAETASHWLTGQPREGV